MKPIKFLLPLLIFLPLLSMAAPVSFTGARLPVQQVVPEKNTGLSDIFIAYDTKGLAINYTATSADAVAWYRFSSLGGAYAEQINNIEKNGQTYSLVNPQGDMGYIIEEGTKRYYFWLTDYSKHMLDIQSIEIPSEQDCSMAQIHITGQGAPIHYYTINGRQCVLDRALKLSYYTLDYSDENQEYTQVHTTTSIQSFTGNIFITPAPLCNTTFTLSGDRFLDAWNWGQSVTSPQYVTPAVQVHVYAEQAPISTDPDYRSNMMNSGSNGDMLGGSAPADITFTAICSDAVMHYEWQFSKDPDFNDFEYRFTERVLDYTFREEGTTYVRFIGSNSDGSCEDVSDTFTVSIGASDLKCPNAFSPGASEGVNDEWKVSYRSIIDFKCWIFNRHGRQLYHFTDPEQGWDGKVGGKVVNTGVYYYVIEATGADGKKYKLSGDINVIGYKPRTSTPSPEE